MRETRYLFGVNGWLAAVTLILLVYIYYYSTYYPQMWKQYNENYFQSMNTFIVAQDHNPSGGSPATNADDSDPNTEIVIVAPKYISEIDSQIIQLDVKNKHADKRYTDSIEIVGKIGSYGQAFQPQGDALVFSEHEQDTFQYQFVKKVDVAPLDANSYLIDMKLLRTEAILEGDVILLQLRSRNYSQNNEPLQFSGDVVQIGNCHPRMKDGFCLSQNTMAVFQQSAINHLLLPPFSAAFIPLFVFFLVWIIEGILPRYKPKLNKDNKGMMVLGKGMKQELIGARFLVLVLIAVVFLIVFKELVGYALLENTRSNWIRYLSLIFLPAFLWGWQLIIRPFYYVILLGFFIFLNIKRRYRREVVSVAQGLEFPYIIKPKWLALSFTLEYSRYRMWYLTAYLSTALAYRIHPYSNDIHQWYVRVRTEWEDMLKEQNRLTWLYSQRGIPRS